MKQSWIKNLSPENARMAEDDYKGSAGARIRLTEMLQDKLRVANTMKIKKDGYELPNWAFMQADYNGYERALQEVISLISDISE